MVQAWTPKRRIRRRTHFLRALPTRNLQKSGWTRSRLSNYFAEDFEKYSIEKSTLLLSDMRRAFHNHLLDNVVYFPHGRSVKIATAFRSAVEEELP